MTWFLAKQNYSCEKIGRVALGKVSNMLRNVRFVFWCFQFSSVAVNYGGENVEKRRWRRSCELLMEKESDPKSKSLIPRSFSSVVQATKFTVPSDIL